VRTDRYWSDTTEAVETLQINLFIGGAIKAGAIERWVVECRFLIEAH